MSSACSISRYVNSLEVAACLLDHERALVTIFSWRRFVDVLSRSLMIGHSAHLHTVVSAQHAATPGCSATLVQPAQSSEGCDISLFSLSVYAVQLFAAEQL